MWQGCRMRTWQDQGMQDTGCGMEAGQDGDVMGMGDAGWGHSMDQG